MTPPTQPCSGYASTCGIDSFFFLAGFPGCHTCQHDAQQIGAAVSCLQAFVLVTIGWQIFGKPVALDMRCRAACRSRRPAARRRWRSSSCWACRTIWTRQRRHWRCSRLAVGCLPVSQTHKVLVYFKAAHVLVATY